MAIKKIYKGGMRAEQLKLFLKAVTVREKVIVVIFNKEEEEKDNEDPNGIMFRRFLEDSKKRDWVLLILV